MEYTTVYIQYKAHLQKGSFSEFKAKKKQQLWEPSRGQECEKFFWASISQLTDWKKDKYITD